MRRSSTIPLAFVALLGAGLTAFLVASLSAGDSTARGVADARGALDPDGRPAGATPTLVPTPLRAEGGRDLRAGPAGTHGGVRPGQREPFDGPEFQRQMSEAARRVVEVLETIPAELDPSKRQILGNELEGLLRRLEGRVDSATRERLFDLFVRIDLQWKPLVGQAIGALRGDVDAARRLLKMSQDPDADVHTIGAVYQALGSIQAQEVVPDLIGMLGQASKNEALIVRAIGAIGGDEGRKALLDRLSTTIRPETRHSIEAVLGGSNDPKIADAAAEALRTSDVAARASLVNVLAMSGAMGARHGDALRDLAENDPDEEVRRRALTALGRIGDPACGEALLRAVEAGGSLAPYATQAIHEIRNPETIGALAARWDKLGDASRAAVMNAAQSLPSPTPELVALARTSLGDRSEGIRSNAARLLGRPGHDDAVEPLVDFLQRASSYRERTAGVEALMKIATPAAAEAVLNQLDALPAAARDGYRERCRKILERRQE